MAITKIRVRFIRTALGPIWEVLGTFIFLIFISLIWSRLWNETFVEFFCYLYTGFIIWKAISAIISDGTYLFSDTYGNCFENVKMNPFVFCLSHTTKNLIVLFLSFPILFIVLYLGNKLYFASILWLSLYFILFFITAVSISFIIATICLKYRDLQYSIIVMLQLFFFITPVIWKIDQVSEKSQRFITDPNIIYHYVEFFRSSLLYGKVEMFNLIIVISSTFVSVIASMILYKIVKNKLVFWIS